MLRHRLPSHVDALTEVAQRLTVVLVQPVKELSARLVGQRLEDLVHPWVAF